MIEFAVSPEAQRAVGYVTTGGLLLKGLDLLIKWRSGQHAETLAEFETARKIGAESREILRQDLTLAREELAESELAREALERERDKLKRQLATTDAALSGTVAELRTLRHIHSLCPEQDEEVLP